MTKAAKPEDLTRLFVEAANRGDAEGIAALYEENAVMAYPPGGETVGRAAIRALWEKVLANAPHFEPEAPLPTLVSGDIALTTTVARDGAGARAEVVRRQPGGSGGRGAPSLLRARPRLDRIDHQAPGDRHADPRDPPLRRAGPGRRR